MLYQNCGQAGRSGLFLCGGLKGANKGSSDQLRITSLARGNKAGTQDILLLVSPRFPPGLRQSAGPWSWRTFVI